MTLALMAVRQEVNNFESSVVVQELEFAMKTDVLLIFSFITGDKTEFLSPMMFSNEYITGI